jgi:hypothetical protein
VCGKIITPAGTHTWSDWTVTTPATITTTGIETRTCTICGATETRNIPSITGITVNGQPADQSNSDNNFNILAQCGDNNVEISITADPGATVTINGIAQNPCTVNLPNYGNNTVIITIAAQNGNSQTCTLTINKPVPASIAYYNRFEGVLTVPIYIESIGKIETVEWYHNDVLLNRDPSKGYIETKEAGSYYALINGKFRTCEVTQLRSASALTMNVYPNPATAGEKVTVHINHTANELQGAHLQLLDINGYLLQTLPVTGSETTLTTPANTGVIVIKLISNIGNNEVKLIVR